MNLQQIRYVVAVAETENFSKAADMLYITESTISKQIKKLEQELDMELFSRSTRKVELTEAGKAFVQQGQIIAGAYDELNRSMEQLYKSKSRVLNVGMTPPVEALDLSRFAVNFNLDHSEVDIRLYTAQADQLRTELLEKRVDVAVVKLPREGLLQFDERTFQYRNLLTEKLLLVAPERKFIDKAGPICLSEAAGLPVICETEGSPMHQALKTYFEENGLPIDISLRTNYAESMFAAVEAGRGIAFATPSICRYYGDRYAFRCVCVEPALENSVCAIWLKEEKLSRPCRQFLEALEGDLARMG